MREVILLDDTRLYLHDEGEDLSNDIALKRDYFEKEILEYLAGRYPQQEIILDIGANIGNHSVYFSQYLENVAIIAFEPVVENYKLLTLNTRNLPNIITRNEAVGAFRGQVGLQVNQGNMGACEIQKEYSVERGDRKVQQVRVDDLFLIPRVTLIKIDVEWYEPEVLAGAKAIIADDQPLILIEDANNTYGSLMPDNYVLLYPWVAHKTYLYGPVENA